MEIKVLVASTKSTATETMITDNSNQYYSQQKTTTRDTSDDKSSNHGKLCVDIVVNTSNFSGML
jgi:hypothetical protein